MDIMEARIIKLESAFEKMLERLFAVERDVGAIRSNYATKEHLAAVERDVAVIRSNYATKEDLAAVQREVAVIRSNYATKEDLTALETRILKWFVATAITLAGVAFAAAKWIN